MRPKDLPYPSFSSESEMYVTDQWVSISPVLPQVHKHYSCWNTFPLKIAEHYDVYVEYCSGNGAWIAQQALAHPHRYYIAVEKQFDRARKIWSKIHNLGLKNLGIIHGEALMVTQRYFPFAQVQGVFVNFPDPWPKRRHARHRLIQRPFLEEVARVLVPGGRFLFVTDHQNYSAQAVQLVSCSPHFTFEYPTPHYVTDYPSYGTSYFEELWRGKGREIFYHAFIRGAV